MARHLITSAIPYINGIKHLGNLVGSQLPADLYARYLRTRGHEVLFLCATDEHGTPAEIAAKKAGKPVAEYCAEMHEVQAKLAEGFRLSFDHFGRSSSPQNHALTQHFAARLDDEGLIREVSETQMYSPTDGRFLPDRYIEGTCPNCGFDSARGDQCDNCTKQLDPADLINPHSTISGATDLEMRETKHLYLRQSAMKDRLEEWIDTREGWPVLTTSIAKKWLGDGDGLQDRGITRDLDWGVPVMKDGAPWPGMEGKVFYVWFDAPIEYIACGAEWVEAGKGDDWERWWRTDKGADDVTYTQFMGKDNVPFHTLSFPATILGSNEPWKLVDYIKSFNYLNYDGGQFSTSRGRGVFMDQALEILPADYWRWWLLSRAPETSDSEFTWEAFQTDVNKDLADVLGNFVSRITKFCRSKFGEAVPEGGAPGDREAALVEEITRRTAAYAGHMDRIEIRRAAAELRAIWAAGNEYLQAAAPWTTFKTDPESAAAQVRLGLNLIALYARLSAPFIPDAAAAMLAAMNAPDTDWPDDVPAALAALPAGHAFTVPDNLFTKITDDQRAEWAERFAGVRD
ncbi:methionine--tRNA ligase [Ponticoccus sp. SC2-23]|uniref:methionine--tRNA ligase n=1 Tax=Alexandriicola marinus TaxID=2081710 RepID=UPI000FDAD8C7|nr:methionine--tRNA ligase [Alexandriicola marinus]MBM1221202.1 methionine--tRNA ligase [Ponticoccus sp. SC6-9]MBM1225772.1 methionine--tRNA ligase [Ponticoccus sp. SC6-15]MBM1227924.1 methionine--tRNA ligase [Ponticoccus sp. SC6-38]MBM1234438.1 methionine--tRNA ligase [Ponticoccus sp. SC6-45]MBM1238426.1 methionine--tRNA ligase [Ponticoccus sp. SC6-49]MBM1243695.1 methionine--tRNA ligase [Ponticoccus sp. SC2-64]MBM1247962.1 methionine--tRNA ligase [Ponticoccus sp. SC6-42]MBM1252826.1 methi